MVSQGLNPVRPAAGIPVPQGEQGAGLSPAVSYGVSTAGSPGVPGLLQSQGPSEGPQGTQQLPQVPAQQQAASVGAPQAGASVGSFPGEEVLYSAPHPVAAIFRKPLEAVARHHVTALVDQLLRGHKVGPGWAPDGLLVTRVANGESIRESY
jgi:hypothetical protein